MCGGSYGTIYRENHGISLMAVSQSLNTPPLSGYVAVFHFVCVGGGFFVACYCWERLFCTGGTGRGGSGSWPVPPFFFFFQLCFPLAVRELNGAQEEDGSLVLEILLQRILAFLCIIPSRLSELRYDRICDRKAEVLLGV